MIARDLNLSIAPGQSVAITGHSRNGKQSLIAAAFATAISPELATKIGFDPQKVASYEEFKKYATQAAQAELTHAADHVLVHGAEKHRLDARGDVHHYPINYTTVFVDIRA